MNSIRLVRICISACSYLSPPVPGAIRPNGESIPSHITLYRLPITRVKPSGTQYVLSTQLPARSLRNGHYDMRSHCVLTQTSSTRLSFSALRRLSKFHELISDINSIKCFRLTSLREPLPMRKFATFLPRSSHASPPDVCQRIIR